MLERIKLFIRHLQAREMVDHLLTLGGEVYENEGTAVRAYRHYFPSCPATEAEDFVQSRAFRLSGSFQRAYQ